MARKSDKEQINKWLEKINYAFKVKNTWRDLFQVPKAYEYYEGRIRPGTANSDEWINVNMVLSTLQAELPSLYSQNPYYYVKLKRSFTPDPNQIAVYEQAGTMRQAALNYWTGESEMKTKARLAILDAFFQFGVMKVAYEAEWVENPGADQPMLYESGELMLDEIGQPILQPKKLLKSEKYAIYRIHPDDYAVDPDSDPIDCGYKIQRIKKPLEDFKEDDRFKHVKNKIRPTEVSDEAMKAHQQRQKGLVAEQDKEEPDIVVYYEVYNLKKKEWFVIAEGCDDWLIKPESLPPGIETDPFITLRYIYRDASWYPIPPVSQWLDSTHDYCDLRSKIKTHRKRFNRKYETYMPGFDDPEKAMSELALGEDGTILGKNTPQPCTSPIQDAPLDQGHYMEMTYLRQDFMDLAYGANQRGATAGVDSATEAGIIEKRTVLREGDRQGLVADFLTEIGKKLDQLIQANITEDMTVKVMGVEGEAWRLVKKESYEDIAGEFSYSIDTGAMTPHLPEIERSQWMAFLGLIANAPILATSQALLKKMAELHHISPEDPLVKELWAMGQQAVQMQMMEGSGAPGSVPGISNQNPVTAMGGASGVNNIRGGVGRAG